MRILLIGAGGVGDAFVRIAARRPFFEALVVTDYDRTRAERTVAAVQERHPGETRLVADRVDASDAAAVAEAPELAGLAAAYLERRLASAAAGELTAVVQHRDLLALPR